MASLLEAIDHMRKAREDDTQIDKLVLSASTPTLAVEHVFTYLRHVPNVFGTFSLSMVWSLAFRLVRMYGRMYSEQAGRQGNPQLLQQSIDQVEAQLQYYAVHRTRNLTVTGKQLVDMALEIRDTPMQERDKTLQNRLLEMMGMSDMTSNREIGEEDIIAAFSGLIGAKDLDGMKAGALDMQEQEQAMLTQAIDKHYVEIVNRLDDLLRTTVAGSFEYTASQAIAVLDRLYDKAIGEVATVGDGRAFQSANGRLSYLGRRFAWLMRARAPARQQELLGDLMLLSRLAHLINGILPRLTQMEREEDDRENIPTRESVLERDAAGHDITEHEQGAEDLKMK